MTLEHSCRSSCGPECATRSLRFYASVEALCCRSVRPCVRACVCAEALASLASTQPVSRLDVVYMMAWKNLGSAVVCFI